MRWDREPWRKLYRNEPEEQRLWPVVTRGLRDYLLRRANDDGVIFSRTEDPAGDLCRSLGAHDNERDIVRDSVRLMLADRFLVHGTETGLAIRNMREAQERRSHEAQRKAAQRERKRAEAERAAAAVRPGTPLGQPRDACPDNVPGSEEKRNDEKRDPPIAPQGGRGGLIERLARAYADGIAEGGGTPWTMPDANVEAPIVRQALELHAAHLRGEAIDRWVKRQAATYRRMMSDVAEYQRGFRPTKWLEWLNGGGEKMQRRIKGTPPERPELLSTRPDTPETARPLSEEEITRRRQKIEAANAALETRSAGVTR